MKNIPLLLLTFIVINVYGQGQEKENKDIVFNRIQIGVNFSPDLNYRTLKNNDGSTNSDQVIKLRNENETVKPGYTVGLNFIYNFNKNIGIETGIQYSNKGYQRKLQDFIYGDFIDPKYGFIGSSNPPENMPIQLTTIFNYYYIDIPLKINFIFGMRKIRIITSVGITANLFVKETYTSIFYYDDATTTRKTYNLSYYDYNSLNISPLISLGIDYKINKSMNLRLEPTFRYGILKIIDHPVTAYLWNTGLNISYYVGF
jgi:hypothetical protein